MLQVHQEPQGSVKGCRTRNLRVLVGNGAQDLDPSVQHQHGPVRQKALLDQMCLLLLGPHMLCHTVFHRPGRQVLIDLDSEILLGARWTAQWVKRLLCKPGDLSSVPHPSRESRGQYTHHSRTCWGRASRSRGLAGCQNVNSRFSGRPDLKK